MSRTIKSSTALTDFSTSKCETGTAIVPSIISSPQQGKITITTSSGMNDFMHYSLALPKHLDVLRGCPKEIEFKEDIVKRQVETFLGRLQLIIMQNRSFLKSIGKLPPLMITQNPDDQSVKVEWVFADFRIGFAFEKEANESSWYFISKEDYNLMNRFGELKEDIYDTLIIKFLTLIINYI